ncbi:MAG: AtpZ/AtpI family protein [Acidobacteriota bacterium]|nr:AtpZ/AtpI family protein [Acidobacteriota bacterium]
MKDAPGEPLGYRSIWSLSSLALNLPVSIAVGLFFGYVLDKWLGTKPWMLIIWTLLGVASGLMTLIRGIRKYDP